MPSNISAATATDLGTLPVSLTQDVNNAGVTQTVWYKYTGKTGDNVIGVFAFGTLSGYRTFIRCWTGTPGALTTWMPESQISAVNVPIQLGVTVGQTYYFEILKSGGGSISPAILTLTAYQHVDIDTQDSSILINDDSEGFPLAILNGATGVVQRFIQNWPSGDYGTTLPNGIKIYPDTFTEHIHLFNPNLTQIIDIPNFFPTGTTSTVAVSQNKNHKFYVSHSGGGITPARVTTINDTGVMGPKTWIFPVAGLQAIAPSPDESILYHTGQSSTINAPIKRWDLINDVALSDLAAAPTSSIVVGKDLLVLNDGNILTVYSPLSGSGVTAYIFNPSGTIIHTYPVPASSGGQNNRLAHALDDPNSFWLWAKLPNGVSRFLNIKISDGSILTSFDRMQYTVGVYDGVETATPVDNFGHSSSCNFFLARVPTTTIPPEPPTAEVRISQLPVEILFLESDMSGLYTPNPNKPGGPFDSYYGPIPSGGGAASSVDVKIPDPTIRTALIGE